MGLRVVLLASQHSDYFSGSSAIPDVLDEQVEHEERQGDNETTNPQVDFEVLIGS